MTALRLTLGVLWLLLYALMLPLLWVAVRVQPRATKGLLAALVALTLGGCTLVLPTEIEEDDELCVLEITLEVVRAGNTYMTNELDIQDNKRGLDCRKVKIREEWIQVDDGQLWLWVYETWDCYRCQDTVDVQDGAI